LSIERFVAQMHGAGIGSAQMWGAGALVAAALLGAILFVVARREGAGEALETASMAGAMAAGALVGAAVVGTAIQTLYVGSWRWGLASWGLFVGAGLVCAAGTESVRARAARLDRIVPTGLVGLAIARLGCLLEGCHGGIPCVGSRGCVRPEAGSALWAMQRAEGLVGAGAIAGVPAHPYPLYAALAGGGAGLVGLVVWALVAGAETRRGPIATSGATAALSLALYFGGRALASWWRAHLVTLDIGLDLTGGRLGLDHLLCALGLVVTLAAYARARERAAGA
jgi:prolipoprotein diacylglyceryltransferase